MKKLNLFVALASLCVALTVCVACSEIALPESLAMKVDAPFDFDVEMNMFDLSDKINVGNISSQTCTVYNYSIGDNVKHFLVTLDAFNFNIDINTITSELAKLPGFSDIATLGWPSSLPAQSITVTQSGTFNANFDFTFKNIISTNISDQVLSSFLTNLNLQDISAYLYIYKSPANVLQNMQTKGSIYISASQSPASTDYILGDTSNKENVKISTSQIMDWSTQGDISKHSGLTKLKSGPIKALLNSTSVSSSSGYDFDCTISIGEADYNALRGSSLELSSTIIVDIPLVFEATSPTNLEIMQLGGMAGQTDILGRGSPNSDFDMLTDVFEYLSLGITPTNQNIFSSDVEISIADPSGSPEIFNISGQGQSHKINTKDKFTVQKANIKNLMNTAPYKPDIKLSIPQNGTLSFPEDSVIKMYMSINAYANGTIKVF